MKILGVNDLRSRIYPKLTEFMALNGDYSSSNKKHLAINWPVTRLEGDYCENTNGYVCQRPAAAGAKAESVGKFLRNMQFTKPFKIDLLYKYILL